MLVYYSRLIPVKCVLPVYAFQSLPDSTAMVDYILRYPSHPVCFSNRTAACLLPVDFYCVLCGSCQCHHVDAHIRLFVVADVNCSRYDVGNFQFTVKCNALKYSPLVVRAMKN